MNTYVAFKCLQVENQISKRSNFKRSDLPAVAWSGSLRVRGSWPCLVSHLFLQGREVAQWELSLGAVRSGSLLPGSAFAVSCTPARQEVQSEEVVFYLEGKTWTESEILAHLTVISSHRYALFHGSRQKSAFPFDIDVEISRTPPACREVGLVPLPCCCSSLIGWLCAFGASWAKHLNALWISELWIAQTEFTHTVLRVHELWQPLMLFRSVSASCETAALRAHWLVSIRPLHFYLLVQPLYLTSLLSFAISHGGRCLRLCLYPHPTCQLLIMWELSGNKTAISEYLDTVSFFIRLSVCGVLLRVSFCIDFNILGFGHFETKKN